MAHETFTVEVLTPEGEVFNDEVEQVSTRTGVGSIGILARHQPLLGLLEPTELRLYKSESDVVRFAQGEGYVQVSGDRVLLLVEEATPPDELDTSDLAGEAPPRRGGAVVGRGRLRGRSAAPRATRSAGRRSCASPGATSPASSDAARLAARRPGRSEASWTSGSWRRRRSRLGVHRPRGRVGAGQPGAGRAQRLPGRGADRPAAVRGPRSARRRGRGAHPPRGRDRRASRAAPLTGELGSDPAPSGTSTRPGSRSTTASASPPSRSPSGGGSRPSWPRRTAATR